MHVLKCALAQVLICNMHILQRYDRVYNCTGLQALAKSQAQYSIASVLHKVKTTDTSQTHLQYQTEAIIERTHANHNTPH